MKIEIDQLDIVEFKDKACVRISIGDYIWLETPFMDIKNAKVTFDNIKQRLE